MAFFPTTAHIMKLMAIFPSHVKALNVEFQTARIQWGWLSCLFSMNITLPHTSILATRKSGKIGGFRLNG
jgi:hypothetical protein